MELIFKLPENKPPFLGILFEDMRQAVTLNQDLVNRRKDAIYSISIEPVGRLLNLRLSAQEPYDVRFYHNLSCDFKKMEAWLLQARQSKACNFSHVVKELNHHMVVKTLQDRKLWVLKISQIKQAWM